MRRHRSSGQSRGSRLDRHLILRTVGRLAAAQRQVRPGPPSRGPTGDEDVRPLQRRGNATPKPPDRVLEVARTPQPRLVDEQPSFLAGLQPRLELVKVRLLDRVGEVLEPPKEGVLPLRSERAGRVPDLLGLARASFREEDHAALRQEVLPAKRVLAAQKAAHLARLLAAAVCLFEAEHVEGSVKMDESAGRACEV